LVVHRIRDPIHDLIEFNLDDELERVVWKIIQTEPFQRLRRIKQLGFSELIYPGATHTRFAHSLGVFHTARELMKIVRRKTLENQDSREKIALAAALVHDVGHGPFSHAFESVGRRLGLKLADHEVMSDELIRKSEIADIFNDEMMIGFSENVADMIKKEGKITFHNAVVSSQFDADRLDYMQRDRMMTGSKHSAIDFTWLRANLDIGDVKTGVDDTEVGTVPTFVIGPKAVQAAEAYVLGLFQLYPTVYFHKATRGAEKIFVELLVRIIELVRDDSTNKTSLSKNHPLIKFASNPDNIEAVLDLDDFVVWGALHVLKDSADPLLSQFSDRLLNRKLYKCFDIRAQIAHKLDPKNDMCSEKIMQIERCCAKVMLEISDLQGDQKSDMPRFITDIAERSPYKMRDENNGPMEQINVRTDGGEFIDLVQRSEIVKSLSKFSLNRVYYDSNKDNALNEISKIIDREVDDVGNKN